MITKTISIAQTIGDHIAEGKLPPWDLLAGKQEYIYIQLKPLKDIEQAIALWQGLLRNFVNIQQHIDLIVTGNKSVIKLIIGIPAPLQSYVENIYFANFSTSDLETIAYEPPVSQSYINFGDEEIAIDADFIKNGQYLDPFKDVLSMYEIVGHDERLDLVYRCVFKKSSGFLSSALKSVKKLITFASPAESTSLTKGGGEAGEIKSAFDGQDATQQVQMKLSFHYQTLSTSAQVKLKDTIKSVFLKYLKSGSIKIGKSAPNKEMRLNQFVNFYHFMTKEFVIPNLEYANYRKLPAPTNLITLNNIENKNDLTVLGYTDYKSDSKMFGIAREDKLRHMYIIGQTGTGKSKFIANMVRSDMISNKGVCVIDPHGDLIDDILSQVPSYRTNDVVLFDVADREFPVGFNVFEYENAEEKPLIASGIVGIFKKMFGNSRGPRLEYILRNVILSLLEYPNATFLDLVRMLTDNNYKEEVLEYVKDPILLRFWRDEFDKFQPKQREEAIAPITNKVGQFTSSTIVRNIFGQSKTKMNFRKMMDEGKIILVNLSKGKVGDDNMAMIGSFIASKIQIDAMSRADIPESQRKDFYLYIDEFQNFATESFATILSEARKYKLALIMANQYISQIDEVVRAAIFGNVGTIICNRIGKDDAEIMSSQFKSMVTANDFLSLPNRRCYTKLMINGMVSDPFSMRTADFVVYEDVDLIKTKVRDQSRQRYAMPRDQLEALMKARAEKKFTMAEKIADKAKAESKAAKERLIQSQSQSSVNTRWGKSPDKSDKGSEKSDKTENNEVPSAKEFENHNSLLENSDRSPASSLTREGATQEVLLGGDPKGGGFIKDINLDKTKDNTVQPAQSSNSSGDDVTAQKVDNENPQNDQSNQNGRAVITSKQQGIPERVLQQETKSTKQDQSEHEKKPREQSTTEYTTSRTPDFGDLKMDDGSKLTTNDGTPKSDDLPSDPKTTDHNTVDHHAIAYDDEMGHDYSSNQNDIIDVEVAEDTMSINDSSSLPTTFEPTNTNDSDEFVIDDLVIGQEYQGYVKLKYNYGLFVTVYGVEGLLHKNFISAPEGLSWKKLYDIGDPITVTAMEFKDIDGQKRVVWSQG